MPASGPPHPSLLHVVLVRLALWLLALASPGLAVAAEPLRIAVAANFLQTAERLSGEFSSQTGELRPVLSSGATGLLYSQIVQGAPFDLFFAADRERPAALEKAGLAVPGSCFTYALGQLVLWRPGRPWAGTLEQALAAGETRVVAIANPAVAPYGAAARQVLEGLGSWERPAFRIVQGESLGQAFQFVATGNAQLGFISLAQVMESGSPVIREEILRIDAGLYDPIAQDAVLLRRGATHPAAQRFLDFVRSARGHAIIAAAGYSQDP